MTDDRLTRTTRLECEPAARRRRRRGAARRPGLILVMFVLPAEYGVDPLGTGARLGLLELGVTGQQVEALEPPRRPARARPGRDHRRRRSAPFKQETVDFTLGPREGMEYKYRLDKGEALLYSWKATAPVNVRAARRARRRAARLRADLREGRAARSRRPGTLTAPFAGIHGWFWENTTDQRGDRHADRAGFYNMSHEFRTGARSRTRRSTRALSRRGSSNRAGFPHDRGPALRLSPVHAPTRTL